MAENTLALLKYLSSDESPLPSLTAGYTKPTTVFFSIFGRFWVYSFQTAKLLYSALFVGSVVVVKATFVPPAPALRQGRGLVSETIRGLTALGLGLLGALVGANAVAFAMRSVFNKALSWFSTEFSCLALFGPAALGGMSLVFREENYNLSELVCLGALTFQLLLGPVREQTVFSSVVLLHGFLACAVQFLGVGSSAVFFLSGTPLALALLINSFVTKPGDDVSLISYAIGQFIPLTVGAQMIYSVLDVFVPLVGQPS